jgi:hypothetical protein
MALAHRLSVDVVVVFGERSLVNQVAMAAHGVDGFWTTR